MNKGEDEEMKWKEIAENCGKIIKEIALALDDYDNAMKEDYNETNYNQTQFYIKVRTAIYGKEKMKQ